MSALLLATLALVALLAIVLVPRLLIRSVSSPEVKDRLDLQIKAASVVAQVVGGLVLIVGSYWAYRTLLSSNESQITERLGRAIDQLGSTHSDGSPNIETRLGGIYSLERLSDDSQRDSWPIIEILSAYVRSNAPRPAAYDPAQLNSLPPARADVQAALRAIGRRRWWRQESPRQIVNLSRCDLRNSDLMGAYLSGASLRASVFDGADLTRANLDGADLSHATFFKTKLYYALVRCPDEALLAFTSFRAADLARADLRGSKFLHTTFAAANMQHTHLEKVIAEFEVDFADAAMPAAHFEGADLEAATGLQKGNLAATFMDERTKFPKATDPRKEPFFAEAQAFARKAEAQGGWREIAREPPVFTPPGKKD